MFNLDLYSDYARVTEDDDDLTRGDHDLSMHQGAMADPVVGAKVWPGFLEVKELDIHNGFYGGFGVSDSTQILLDLLKHAGRLALPKVFVKVNDHNVSLKVAKKLDGATELYQVGLATARSWHDGSLVPIKNVNVYLVTPNLKNLGEDLRKVQQNFLSGSYKDSNGNPTPDFISIMPKMASIIHQRLEDESSWVVAAKAKYRFYSKDRVSRKTFKVGGVREKITDSGLKTHGRGEEDPFNVLKIFKDGNLESLELYGGHIARYYDAWAKKSFVEFLKREDPAKKFVYFANHAKFVDLSREKEANKPVEVDPLDPKAPIKKQEPTKVVLRGREVITVVGSIRSQVGKTVIPTAKDEERVWMKSDGTIRKPVRVGDQEARGLIPSLSGDVRLAPLVREGDYRILYGIYYDNPILGLRNRGNLFWYGSEELLYSAAETYSSWTGDTPRIAFSIYSLADTGSTRAGMQISPIELRREVGVEAREVQSAHKHIVDTFRLKVKDGKRAFPSKLNDFFDGKVDPKQFVGYSVPVTWKKISGIDHESWKNFISEARKNLIKDLGFQLGADKNLWVINKKGEKVNYTTRMVGDVEVKDPILVYSEKRLEQHNKLKASWDLEAHSGDAREEKDEWKNYFITYLLGHKAYASTLNTFMLPIKVEELSGEGVKPTGRHLSVPADKYVEAMWHAAPIKPAYRILANAKGFGSAADLVKADTNTGRKWYYLPSSLSQAFPYARMVIPDVRTNAQVAEANKAFPPRKGVNSLERTTLGYRYLGYEFRAYFMFVSMPKSKAHKKFRIVSGSQGTNALVDPGFMRKFKSHLSKDRGSPMKLGLTPSQSRFIGVGDNAYGFKNPQTIDPVQISGRKMTTLPRGYFSHPAFESQWRPTIKRAEIGVNKLVHTYVHDVERLTNELKTGKINKEDFIRIGEAGDKIYGRKALVHSHVIGSLLKKNMDAFAAEIKKENAREVGSMEGEDVGLEAYNRLDVWVSRMKVDLDSPENLTDEKVLLSPSLPNVTAGVKTTVWEARIGHAFGGREFNIRIKAPTSDMAKLYIMYRLLRRSAANPSLGRHARYNIDKTDINQQKFLSAKYLFNWAASDFLVLPDDGVRGLKYIPSRTRYEKNEFLMKHAGKYGAHTTARLVGFGLG